MDTMTMFGTTTLVVQGRRLAPGDLGGVKPRQVLELLALAGGTPVPKDRLAELLWEGRPPRGWMTTLQSHVSVLRRCSGLDGGRHGALATVTRGYLLDPELVRVDHTEAVACLRTGGTADVQRALALAEGGELLASDPYVGWAEDARDDLATRLVDALVAASDDSAATDPALSARLARSAWQRAPLSEAAAQCLMRAQSAAGDPVSALRTYATLTDRLCTDLGVRPGTASARLAQQLRSQTAAASPATVVDGGTQGELVEVLRRLVDVLLDPDAVTALVAAAPTLRLVASQ